jgi:hypothetical protein
MANLNKTIADYTAATTPLAGTEVAELDVSGAPRKIALSTLARYPGITISPAQIVANTDNYNPTGLSTAGVLRVSTDASRNLTGIVAQADGPELLICNIGAFDLVLKHDTTSTAANRFYTPNNADFTIRQNGCARLFYDLTSTRWRVVAA